MAKDGGLEAWAPLALSCPGWQGGQQLSAARPVTAATLTPRGPWSLLCLGPPADSLSGPQSSGPAAKMRPTGTCAGVGPPSGTGPLQVGTGGARKEEAAVGRLSVGLGDCLGKPGPGRCGGWGRWAGPKGQFPRRKAQNSLRFPNHPHGRAAGGLRSWERCAHAGAPSPGPAHLHWRGEFLCTPGGPPALASHGSKTPALVSAGCFLKAQGPVREEGGGLLGWVLFPSQDPQLPLFLGSELWSVGLGLTFCSPWFFLGSSFPS